MQTTPPTTPAFDAPETLTCGDATVKIEQGPDGAWFGTVEAPEIAPWPFSELRLGSAPDCPRAAAREALAFLTYYTTDNRGDDVPDWAPPGPVADALDAAAWDYGHEDRAVTDEQGARWAPV